MRSSVQREPKHGAVAHEIAVLAEAIAEDEAQATQIAKLIKYGSLRAHYGGRFGKGGGARLPHDEVLSPQQDSYRWTIDHLVTPHRPHGMLSCRDGRGGRVETRRSSSQASPPRMPATSTSRTTSDSLTRPSYSASATRTCLNARERRGGVRDGRGRCCVGDPIRSRDASSRSTCAGSGPAVTRGNRRVRRAAVRASARPRGSGSAGGHTVQVTLECKGNPPKRAITPTVADDLDADRERVRIG